MENVLTALAKSVFILLGLMAVAPATNVAIQNTIYGSEYTLLISNEEIKDPIRIAESHKKSVFLIKGTSETTENEAKKLRDRFLSITCY